MTLLEFELAGFELKTPSRQERDHMNALVTHWPLRHSGGVEESKRSSLEVHRSIYQKFRNLADHVEGIAKLAKDGLKKAEKNAENEGDALKESQQKKLEEINQTDKKITPFPCPTDVNHIRFLSCDYWEYAVELITPGLAFSMTYAFFENHLEEIYKVAFCVKKLPGHLKENRAIRILGEIKYE